MIDPHPEPLVPCTNCHGTGGVDTQRNQLGIPPPCRTCKGLGRFRLSLMCECGMPAVWRDGETKICYCGEIDCLMRAKTRQSYSTGSTL
jgi:hypothetical protein